MNGDGCCEAVRSFLPLGAECFKLLGTSSKITLRIRVHGGGAQTMA